MTAAQKAAAKAAREADARSATAASLTEEELTALLQTKRDAAAAAAAKEAADAEAARAAEEAEEAAAPTSSKGENPGFSGFLPTWGFRVAWRPGFVAVSPHCTARHGRFYKGKFSDFSPSEI